MQNEQTLYRQLGTTDIRVSPVCMGCWAIVGDSTWGAQDERDSIEAIQAALEAGINFFDTAEAYGDGYSEEVLAKALAGKRDQVVLSSKVWDLNMAKADLRRSCEQSLRRLKTDYIDLYQLHWPSRTVPFSESAEALIELRQEGKIRAIGVSNFGPQDLSAYLETGECVSNQLPYNLLFRAIEFDILPRCVENNISILCYSPLMQGLLTGKFSTPDDVPEGRARTRLFAPDRPMSRHHESGCEEEVFAAIRRIRAIADGIGKPMSRVALAWLLHQPGVASVVAGARNASQSRENARAAELKLDESTLRELAEATESIKQAIGANADLWQTESRMA